METIINRGSLSQNLQDQLAALDVRLSEYKDLQTQFREVEQETQRLNLAAEALDAEAATANQEWKALAQERTVDQKKVNSKIEQGTKLKADADRQRNVAEVREVLRCDLLVRMAQARLNLQASIGPLNTAYRHERIETLMKTEGLNEVLTELFALVSDSQAAERALLGLGSHSSLLSEQEDRAEADLYYFGKFLVKQLKQSGIKPVSAAVISMPPPVHGEVVASGMAALKRFQEDGGKISIHAARSGSLRVA